MRFLIAPLGSHTAGSSAQHVASERLCASEGMTLHLMTPDGVDEALVQGFDIDSLVGIDINGSGYFNDA